MLQLYEVIVTYTCRRQRLERKCITYQRSAEKARQACIDYHRRLIGIPEQDVVVRSFRVLDAWFVPTRDS